MILSVLGYNAGRSVQVIATVGKEQCYQDEELPAQQVVLYSLNQDWPTWWTKQRRACYWKDAGFMDGKFKKKKDSLADSLCISIKDPKVICPDINFDAISQLLEWVIALCPHCHWRLPASLSLPKSKTLEQVYSGCQDALPCFVQHKRN